jgi:hypothetical protein
MPKGPVSYAKAIRSLFTQRDIDHMRPFDVHLDQHDWMSDPAGGSLGGCDDFPDHANARTVFAFVNGDCTPRMPLGGPFWHPDMLALYQRWMDDDFQP